MREVLQGGVFFLAKRSALEADAGLAVGVPASLANINSLQSSLHHAQ
jgi:hypothetical protein